MAKKPRKPRSLTFGTRLPYKATPALIKAILADLARGLTRRQACAANGIGDSTLQEWEKRPEFEGLRDKAEAVRILYLLERIEQCRTGDWKRFQWDLIKTFPKQFGRSWGRSNRLGKTTLTRKSIL